MYWIPHPYFVSTYWFICLHFYYLATLITYHCEFKNWLAEITELDLCIPVYYDLYYSVVSEVAHSKHSFLFFFLFFFFFFYSYPYHWCNLIQRWVSTVVHFFFMSLILHNLLIKCLQVKKICILYVLIMLDNWQN